MITLELLIFLSILYSKAALNMLKLMFTLFNVHYVPTCDQVADIFSKPLSATRFTYLCDKLTVLEDQSRLRGRVRDKLADLHSS